MSIPRHGSRTGFFDGTTTFNQSTNPGGGVLVPAGAISQWQETGRDADNFSFYVSVTGSVATTWQLECAHSGGWTIEGINQDPDTFAQTFHTAWYLGTSGAGNSTLIKIDIGAAGGSIMTMVPDYVPGYCRLHRTDVNVGNVTVTAGWELQSD